MFLNIHVVVVVVLALCTQPLSARRHYQTLRVWNGADWGDWGPLEMCPSDSYAEGFSIRVESRQGDGDDTAVNGIRLTCVKDGRQYGTVASNYGYWGNWKYTKWCSSGALTRFMLDVEGRQGSGDDTAVNNIMFQCSGGDIKAGYGMPWGRWGSWSQMCHRGGRICGIQTRVERPQGGDDDEDDTALNDVRFVCCR